ncbi:MAG: cysteine desulfurase [Candidatus Dadabacteria bacterium]|nr:cysteine desulfurase [Candidatus Dadabacteria bacterium]
MEKVINKLPSFNAYEIRSDFPIFSRKVNGKPLIYLDNAATSQKPRRVIDGLKSYYENNNSNIHRGVHTLSYESTVMYEDAHKKVAGFIGASDWKEIVFTRNATESLNLIAYSWGLHNLDKGDEVLISIMEHHSNIVPWQMLCQARGIVLKFIDVDEKGNLDLESFERLLTDKTRVVSIIHVSNVLGVVNPINYISKKAREQGAILIIDAAQSVPHINLNVKELDCDFLVASGHKMLGPTGIGFLYGKKALLESMEPFLFGGDMISTVTKEKSTWNELPWKYEAGTPNIAGGIGLGHAIDYLENIGLEQIEEHESELLDYTLNNLKELPWLEIYTPLEGQRVGVVSFNVKGVHPHDVAGVMDEDGIAVRSGHHCTQPLMNRLNIEYALRASFYLYNTKEEIDQFLISLKRAYKIFKR